jgi:SAM-dependent methyltransferase
MSNKFILDVCCGSKMFYFDKENKQTIYMDNRKYEGNLCDGRKLIVNPDLVGDFRNIPFEDNIFRLVVFDPPHLLRVGEKSWLAKKYGKLNENWKEDIKIGFSECFRVLKYEGILIFKWNEEQIKLKEILKLTKHKPLLGNKRAKTHWLIFIKEVISLDRI